MAIDLASHFDELTPLSYALWPLSLLYAAGWETYAATYRLGLKKSVKPHAKIVCIGNLKVGGSGKTPFTIYTAQLLQELGFSVVLGLSGYGSPRSKAAVQAPPGPLNPQEWGDEPSLVRDTLPDIPMIVGRRRVLAAEIANMAFPRSVFLMDDGFQHLPLAKDLNVILDASGGNHLCLPAGPYREPSRNLSRADLAVPSPGFEPVRTVFCTNSDGTPADTKGDVNLLTAIAHPRRVIDSATALGFTVRQTVLLADHDPLRADNLLADLPSNVPLLVTAKDWVKLRHRDDIGHRDVRIMDVRVHLADDSKYRALLTHTLTR